MSWSQAMWNHSCAGRVRHRTIRVCDFVIAWFVKLLWKRASSRMQNRAMFVPVSVTGLLECMHVGIVAVKFVLSLCSVRCPICCVSACSSIWRTLQNCRIWTCGFFSPFRETQSSGRLVQSWTSQWPSGGTRGSTSSRKRIEQTSISLPMTRLLLGSWGDVKNHCGWPDCSWGRSERCTWRSTACCQNQ